MNDKDLAMYKEVELFFRNTIDELHKINDEEELLECYKVLIKGAYALNRKYPVSVLSSFYRLFECRRDQIRILNRFLLTKEV